MFDTRLSKRTKHRPSNTRTKEVFYVFDRTFDGLQVLSNTTKYDQTLSNSTKQGVQTVKCLVNKQCLMVFGRQTFIVCPGPKALDKREMFGDQTESNIFW